jgi:hypothetical protein
MPLELQFMLEEWAKILNEKELAKGKVIERCQTTMLLTYKVKQRQSLEYEGDKFPIYHSYRLDAVPLSETALGLTYRRGEGSIVILNSTRDFALHSVLPALVYRGHNRLLPLWLQGSFQLEKEVAETYENLLDSMYSSDKKSYNSVKQIAKSVVVDENYADWSRLRHSLLRVEDPIGPNMGENWIHSGLDALSSVLKKRLEEKNQKKSVNQLVVPNFSSLAILETQINQSVAYHEAYHQIPKTRWQQPTWVTGLLGKKPIDSELRDGILEEMGAYLVGMYYGEKTSTLWLTQIFFFSINVLMKEQPEYYASRILLDSLAKVNDSSFTPGLEEEPLKLLKAYNALKVKEVKDEGQLAVLAEKTYQKLFNRPLPKISPSQ